MKLKVCGMREMGNSQKISLLKPDYMGFVFYEKSKRYVENSTLNLPKEIKKVGVFVDATAYFVSQKIEEHGLDSIQLHGEESPSFCAEFSKKTEVIKAFSMTTEFDFSRLEVYENTCDFYLFDTKGKLPGGNGYTFDWSILKAYPSSKPFFLSGGIGLEEVAKIQELRKMNLPLYGVDVNSKFEQSPAVKNVVKVKQFKEQLF